MVKKSIVVMVAILLAFSLVACNSAEKEMYTLLDSSSCCPQIEQSDSYWDNIALSITAYEEVITHFQTADEQYTDDFGGVFVDNNGIYNICVVGNREPITSDYLIYKRVDNSYNFLYSIFKEATKVMKEYSVWRISICEQCNGVLVCLDDDSKVSPLIKHLKANNLLKKGTLNIFIGENEMVLTGIN